MHKFKIIALFAMLGMSSCSEDQNDESSAQDEAVIAIKPRRLAIDDTQIDTIKLVCPSNFLLGAIDKLVVGESYIMAADFFQTKRAAVFDDRGNFLQGIDFDGPGPEEYNGIKDIDIRKKDGIYHFYILDSHGYCKTFDADGLLSSVDVPYNVSEIAALEDQMVFKTEMYSSEKFGENLDGDLVFQKGNDFLVLGKKTDRSNIPIFECNALSSNGNVVAVSNTFDNFIKVYENRKLISQFKIGYQDKEFDMSFFSKEFANPLDRINAFNEQEGAYHIPNLFIDSKIILSSIMKDREHKTILLNYEQGRGEVWEKFIINARHQSNMKLMEAKEGYLYFLSPESYDATQISLLKIQRPE